MFAPNMELEPTTELAGHVEFGVLVFVRLLLLYHLLLTTTTPGRSEFENFDQTRAYFLFRDALFKSCWDGRALGLIFRDHFAEDKLCT